MSRGNTSSVVFERNLQSYSEGGQRSTTEHPAHQHEKEGGARAPRGLGNKSARHEPVDWYVETLLSAYFHTCTKCRKADSPKLLDENRPGGAQPDEAPGRITDESRRTYSCQQGRYQGAAVAAECWEVRNASAACCLVVRDTACLAETRRGQQQGLWGMLPVQKMKALACAGRHLHSWRWTAASFLNKKFCILQLYHPRARLRSARQAELRRRSGSHDRQASVLHVLKPQF